MLEGSGRIGELSVSRQFEEDSEYRCRLYHTTIRNQSPSLCSVLILHDIGEHSQLYLDFASILAHQSMEVHLMDLRGHGLSSGPRLGGSLRNYLEDLVVGLSRVTKGIPLFIVAQGAGASTLCAFLRNNSQLPLGGAVLVNPILASKEFFGIRLARALFVLAVPSALNVDSPVADPGLDSRPHARKPPLRFP